jgi:hypothetical protein
MNLVLSDSRQRDVCQCLRPSSPIQPIRFIEFRIIGDIVENPDRSPPFSARHSTPTNHVGFCATLRVFHLQCDGKFE